MCVILNIPNVFRLQTTRDRGSSYINASGKLHGIAISAEHQSPCACDHRYNHRSGNS